MRRIHRRSLLLGPILAATTAIWAGWRVRTPPSDVRQALESCFPKELLDADVVMAFEAAFLGHWSPAETTIDTLKDVYRLALDISPYDFDPGRGSRYELIAATFVQSTNIIRAEEVGEALVFFGLPAFLDDRASACQNPLSAAML